MPKLSPEDQYQRDLRAIFTLERHWAPIHDAVTKRVEFLLDGKHYEDDDSDSYTLSSRSVRWVGQETFHVFRHEIGVVSHPGQRIARPVDDDGDPELAEVASSLVESVTEDPAKEFEDTMEDVIGSASAASYGVAWLDHLPDEGPWGEIVVTCDDPRNFMCDPRVRSIHDPRCKRIVRIVRMTLGEAKRRAEAGGWDKEAVANLRPDSGRDIPSLYANLVQRDAPLAHLGTTSEPSKEFSDEDEFTAYYLWERKSSATRTEKQFTEYADGQRYMRCHTCGYRSATQDELKKADKIAGELPDMLEGGCPECMDAQEQDPTLMLQPGHGDLMRVDGEELRNELLAYPEGRLVILAPYSGLRIPLYDDAWPWKLRSFPAMFLSRFRHPFKMFGPSLSDLNWWNQIATDMLMRLSIERLLNTSPVWVSPLDGLEDANGNRFEFSDENGWNAYYTGDSLPAITQVGGDPGIPAAWSQAYTFARNALTSHTGIADFSMEPGQSRDIAASSVSQQIQQEEVPQAHFRRRYQRQRGLFEGVLYDLIRATYPAERVLRLRGKDGQDYLRAMAASDLPNYDFRFDSSPDLKPQNDMERAATEMLIATLEQRPWAVDLVAQANHFSPGIVRKAKEAFQKFQQEQMAQMQQQQAAAMGGGAGPAPAPGPDVPQQESPSSMVERMLGGLAPTAAQQG